MRWLPLPLFGQSLPVVWGRSFAGSAAQAVAFFASDAVALRPKLIAYSSVLVLGCVCFFCAECEARRHRQKGT